MQELLRGDRKFSVEDFERVIHRDDVNSIVATLLPIARAIAIPYQRTPPHNLPVVDASLDCTSPPLTCLDTGTIWSQPGNLYSQIVDLADVDRSRSMIAPGNAEDSPYRTNQVDLWVRGTMHPAPLSRAKVEAPGVKAEGLTAVTYTGPLPLAQADAVRLFLRFQGNPGHGRSFIGLSECSQHPSFSARFSPKSGKEMSKAAFRPPLHNQRKSFIGNGASGRT